MKKEFAKVVFVIFFNVLTYVVVIEVVIIESLTLVNVFAVVPQR